MPHNVLEDQKEEWSVKIRNFGNKESKDNSNRTYKRNKDNQKIVINAAHMYYYINLPILHLSFGKPSLTSVRAPSWGTGGGLNNFTKKKCTFACRTKL